MTHFEILCKEEERRCSIPENDKLHYEELCECGYKCSFLFSSECLLCNLLKQKTNKQRRYGSPQTCEWLEESGRVKTRGELESAAASNPQNLGFQKSSDSQTSAVCTQRGLCGFHISQSPHSICMHSSAPVCACHLPFSLL